MRGHWFPIVLPSILAFACTRGTTQQPRPSATVVGAITDAAAPVVDGSSDSSGTVVDGAEETRTLDVEGAPPIKLRTVGPALIEVAGGDAKVASPKRVEIERRVITGGGPSDVVQRHTVESAPSAPRPWRALHAATHAATYAYRARVSGAWSPEVLIRTSAPSASPATPSALRVVAKTPFATQIAWDATGHRAAGFELEVKTDGDFTRAALVNPDERAFEHHLRLPGEVVSYRVRAFNARGASAFTEPVTITMPSKVEAKSGGPLAACAAVPTKPASGSGCNPDIEKLDAGEGRVLLNVPSAKDACLRRLMGNYKGCNRELGAFALQADVVVVPGSSNDGFPLLHAVAGAGQYVGAQILTLHFAGGRYTSVDTAEVCGDVASDPSDPTLGEVDGDITRCAPPFATCQRDTGRP